MTKIKTKDIISFKDHPYKVEEDDSLKELMDSIKKTGLIHPVIVREKNNKYEMISGHRRLKAYELLGIDEIEADIKELTDDEAIVFMVDSNIHREKILPSEKAMAYKMKYDALKQQGKTLFPSGTESELNETKTQVYRYIRLNNLIPELLQLVDDTVLKDKRAVLTMGLRPAVELSYLSKDDQELVYEEITYEDLTPSHVQAKRIRELGEKGELDSDILESIFLEQKPNQAKRLSFNEERIRKVLPKDIKDYKIEDFIIKAIESYSKTLSNERGDSYDLDI